MCEGNIDGNDPLWGAACFYSGRANSVWDGALAGIRPICDWQYVTRCPVITLPRTGLKLAEALHHL